VIVTDFDFVRIAGLKSEANAPLIIDRDGMLPLSIILQCMEPIAWRNCQVVKAGREIGERVGSEAAPSARSTAAFAG
jgi:hypothetical protein